MSKFITRTVLLVSLISFFTDIASEMLYPVMPAYLTSIGFSVVLIGILEGIAEATAGISKGYFGNLSDAIGKRMIFVRMGYALSAFSKPLFAVSGFHPWVFFVRTLDRFGKGIRTSARDALLSDESTPENKGKVFGFHRSLDTLGAAVGPIMALLFLLWRPGDYKNLFLIAFLPGIAAIFISLLVKEKIKSKHGETKKKPGFFSFIKYWKQAPFIYKKLVIGLLIFTIFNSSDAFLLLAIKHKGYSDLYMIGVYIFYNIIYALASYPAGMLADKIGMKTILIIGIFMFAITYALIPHINQFAGLLIIFALYGIYAAFTEGISKAWISNISDKEHTATAIGFYNSAYSICILTASTLAGIIWAWAGAKAMFTVSAIGAVAICIYLMSIKVNKQISQA